VNHGFVTDILRALVHGLGNSFRPSSGNLALNCARYDWLSVRVGTRGLRRCRRRFIGTDNVALASCMRLDSQQASLVEVTILGSVLWDDLKRWSRSRHTRHTSRGIMRLLARCDRRIACSFSLARRLGDNLWARWLAMLVRPIVERRVRIAAWFVVMTVFCAIAGSNLLRQC